MFNLSINNLHTPQGQPAKLKPTFDKLDRDKLDKDIEKRYENAGVPPEAMSFWNKLDEVFLRLESEALINDEVHPLDVLLSKQHFHTDVEQTEFIPQQIIDAVQKDHASLPEVCEVQKTYSRLRIINICGW